MNNMLYHYTSFDSLRNIVRDGELTFWAFHIHSMEDEWEYRFFRTQLVHELIDYDKDKHGGLKQEEIKKNIDFLFLTGYLADPFIVSLCKKRDDRSMWENYANSGQGVCLEFSADELHALNGVSLQECLYAPTEENFLEESLLESFYDYVISIPSSPKIIIPYSKWFACVDMLIRTKRTYYESEAECRLVKCSEIWNHAQNNFDRPYVELSIPPTALRSITLGPCTPNLQQAEAEVRELLCTHLGAAESERIIICSSLHDSRSVNQHSAIHNGIPNVTTVVRAEGAMGTPTGSLLRE